MSSISCLKVNINPLRNDVRTEKMRGQVPVKWKVKAMGGETGGKYKGTQLREKKLSEMIESKVMEAKKACDGDHDGSDECKVAWDEVEEVSQAKAHLRSKLERQEDPLESYCHGNPETDECLVYDD